MTRRSLLLSAAGANNKITIVLMGVRGRGRSLTEAFAKMSDVDIAYVCDVDTAVVEPALKLIEKTGRKRPPVVTDIRRCLDDKSVDAVVMGTPIHWHAPGTILACSAGKDVYVEKPVSHNIREGRLMIDAARRYNRIVQAGTQLPSLPVTERFNDYAQSGKLGRVLMAKVWNVQLRRNIGRMPDEPIPAGLDYDTWTGPVKQLPFNKNRFHGTVNWHWHYGCGDIGNDGVHELDIARRALRVSHPKTISGMGKKLYFDDDHQTPDTMNITYDFGDKIIQYEQRLWNPYGLEACDNGVAVYGDKAVAQFGRFRDKEWGFRVYDDKNKLVHEDQHDGTSIDAPHARNFLDCIKSRRRPNVEIAEGHYSTTLAHLGNIVARTGRAIRFNANDESVEADREANALIGREYRQHWSTPKG